MIGHLKGVVSIVGIGHIVLDVGGVGYKIHASQGTLALFKQGDTALLFTHMAVRENALDLYGFLSRSELEFFEMVISVSGIGPKTAIAILGLAPVETLKRAIAGGDATHLTKVSGIGKKNAEKIIVELKDKLGGADAAARILIGADAEALEALEALGYSMRDARESIAKTSGVTAQEKIREALRALGGKGTV